MLAALLNQRTHIKPIILTHDNVVTARAEGIASFDGDLSWAGVAEHLKTTHNTPAMQIAIMQLVLLDDVVVETVEVFFCQQLPRKEARTTQTLQAAAGRTNVVGYWPCCRRSPDCHCSPHLFIDGW
jgi:hypothetical protein